MQNLSERSQRFQTAIKTFINERREAKFKGAEPDSEAASRYEYNTWLADAARRVGQIQAVTHVLKATHPDARGSSLHISPETLPAHSEIGSHSLGGDYAADVVGNAAALDVFKFLKIEVGGQRLLEWIQAGDAELQKALHPEPEVAQEWINSFRNLVRGGEQPTSHVTAKQLFWCTGDDPVDNASFHLLQPLFSSSLTHAIHANVKEVRFSETNKETRKAFRERQPHDAPYREYRGLAVRKLGGTKPQNISQLNSDRGGVKYLFPSLPPPKWKKQRVPSFLHTDSVLGHLGYDKAVRNLIGVQAQLRDFPLDPDEQPLVVFWRG